MIDINSLITDALKKGDTLRLPVYRNLKAYQQRYLTQKDKVSEEEAQVAALRQYESQLLDSIQSFQKAGREDLLIDAEYELDVVRELMPDLPTEGDILDLLEKDTYFDKYRPEGKIWPLIPKKEMGIAIKFIKGKLPFANGKMVSSVVKTYVV